MQTQNRGVRNATTKLLQAAREQWLMLALADGGTGAKATWQERQEKTIETK